MCLKDLTTFLKYMFVTLLFYPCNTFIFWIVYTAVYLVLLFSIWLTKHSSMNGVNVKIKHDGRKVKIILIEDIPLCLLQNYKCVCVCVCVCVYINLSEHNNILVYIMFIIYNIRATSFGFMPSSGPL